MDGLKEKENPLLILPGVCRSFNPIWCEWNHYCSFDSRWAIMATVCQGFQEHFPTCFHSSSPQFWGLKQVLAQIFWEAKPSWFYRSYQTKFRLAHGGCWELIKRKPHVPGFGVFFPLFLSISQFEQIKTCSSEDSIKPMELHTPTARDFLP